MNPFASNVEELGALRRAAARARGCVVRAVSVGDDGRLRSSIDCVDGWAAARLVLALAAEEARTSWARSLAGALRDASGPSDLAFAGEVMRFVSEHVRFVREAPGSELFQSGPYSLEIGQGDCEDHARLIYAIATAGGLPARMAFLHRGDGPTHAVALLVVGGVPLWAETTIAARLGEHPIAAGRRLGILTSRGDIAERVRVMTERNDLAPIPRRFVEANDPAQVERDGQALARLGFLASCDVTKDATAPAFRAAVHAFQKSAGIVADGLIGPQTRRAIGGALPLDEFGMGYLGATTAAAPKHSAHLSPAFFRDVEAMAARFRQRGASVSALDLLSVWLYESGVRADRPNGGGAPYYGLNQMGVSELAATGFRGSPADWMALSEEEQLPYVERFYQLNVRAFLEGDWSGLSSPTALYLMNFLPAYSKHAGDPSFVLARDPHSFYRSNRGFDAARKGWIEVGDLSNALERAKVGPYWQELVARARAEGGSEPVWNGARILGGVALVALLVAGAVLVNR